MNVKKKKIWKGNQKNQLKDRKKKKNLRGANI